MFELTKGKRNSITVNPASAAVIAVGGAIQFDEANKVVDAVSGAEVYAIAQEASASGETAPIKAEVIYPENVYKVTPSAGTVGTTLRVGQTCDITSGADAVDMTATSNNDVIIVGEIGTTALEVSFKNCVHG